VSYDCWADWTSEWFGWFLSSGTESTISVARLYLFTDGIFVVEIYRATIYATFKLDALLFECLHEMSIAPAQ